MENETVELFTYPSYYLEDGKTENENYDNEEFMFVVPTWWLKSQVGDLNEFMSEYTWDWTLWLYERAWREEMVLHEETVAR